MKNDLISRSAHVAFLESRRFADPYPANDYQRGYNCAMSDAIRHAKLNAPALDAVPVVHARWDDGHRCTECICLCTTAKTPQGYLIFIETPYCPNCGARMDGESDGTD